MASVPLRVLLIQPWVTPVEQVRAPLVRAGYLPRITRVDFESALEAAISRADFDVIVLDPHTPGISRSLVEASMRDHSTRAPLVVIGDVVTIGHDVKRALTVLQN